MNFFAERHRNKSQEEPATTDLMAVSDDLGKRIKTILFKFASGIQLQDDIEKGASERQRRRTWWWFQVTWAHAPEQLQLRPIASRASIIKPGENRPGSDFLGAFSWPSSTPYLFIAPLAVTATHTHTLFIEHGGVCTVYLWGFDAHVSDHSLVLNVRRIYRGA